MSILPKAAKAKGRSLQHWVCRKLSEVLGLPWGKDELIAPREMGQSGTDVRLVGEAKRLFPFSVECKNCTRWRLAEFVEQAKANCSPETDWLLVLKRTSRKASKRIDPLVVMDAEAFFALMHDLIHLRRQEDARRSAEGATQCCGATNSEGIEIKDTENIGNEKGKGKESTTK